MEYVVQLVSSRFLDLGLPFNKSRIKMYSSICFCISVVTPTNVFRILLPTSILEDGTPSQSMLVARALTHLSNSAKADQFERKTDVTLTLYPQF